MTVVVPVFNRLALLRATVASLQAQTLEESEFILVDDRSDTETREYLRHLGLSDGRFEVIEKPDEIPRGCQTSRNLGLDRCRTDAIVFLDSDDLISPSCLKQRLSFLRIHKQADIIVGRQALFHESVGTMNWVNLKRSGVLEIDRFLRIAAPIDVPWVNGGVIFRTESLRRANVRWRPEFDWDDVAFHFECLVHGLTVRWMSQGSAPDFYYREHEGDRFGRRLFTSEGILRSSQMIVWMRNELAANGLMTRNRRDALATSFFHCCVLRAMDRSDHNVANEVIHEATNAGFLASDEGKALLRYDAGRRALRSLPTANYYWDRLNQKFLLPLFFGRSSDEKQTYGTVAPESPEAILSLRALVARTTPPAQKAVKVSDS